MLRRLVVLLAVLSTVTIGLSALGLASASHRYDESLQPALRRTPAGVPSSAPPATSATELAFPRTHDYDASSHVARASARPDESALAPQSSLYRAVSQAEADDIARFGFRQQPDLGSMSGKLFATSAEDATRWGRMLYEPKGQAFQVVRVDVPRSFADSLYRFPADSMQAVSVELERLGELNRIGRISQLDALPWWPKG